MQNQQGLMLWLWNNHPWLIVPLVLSFIAMAVMTRRFSVRMRNAAVGTPRIVMISAFIGAIVGGVCGANIAPVPGLGQLTIIVACLAFAGAMFGGNVGIILQEPRHAARGIVWGLCAFAAFLVVDLCRRWHMGLNMWNAQVWETRTVMLVLFAFAGASLTAWWKHNEQHGGPGDARSIAG